MFLQADSDQSLHGALTIRASRTVSTDPSVTDGAVVMFGERVLAAGWVARSAAPNGCSDGTYGWQLWLNADPDGDGPRARRWPALPADLLHMDGHEGQYVVVSPSAGLVVVRLGCTKAGGFPLAPFLRAVHAALG